MGSGEVPPRAVDGGNGFGREDAWVSGLPVNAFTCVRAAGFEPVGQVMGASVHVLDLRAIIEFAPSLRFDPAASDLRRYDARTVFYVARDRAMEAMVAHCRALGGDGIIAVRVDIGPFEHEHGTVAFRVQGTAVRARGRVRPARPFASHLNAQEFAKLIEAGWVPVDLVLGVAVEGLYGRQTGRFARNKEARGWNDAVASVRRRARNLLTYEAAQAGADGVVISEADLRVHRESAERFVEARIIGSAIAGFGPNRPRSPDKRAGPGRPRASLRTSSTLRPENSLSSRTLSAMRLSPDVPDRR